MRGEARGYVGQHAGYGLRLGLKLLGLGAKRCGNEGGRVHSSFILACSRLNYAPCREEVLGALHPNPMAMRMSTAPIYLGTTATSIKNNDNDYNDNIILIIMVVTIMIIMVIHIVHYQNRRSSPTLLVQDLRGLGAGPATPVPEEAATAAHPPVAFSTFRNLAGIALLTIC